MARKRTSGKSKNPKPKKFCDPAVCDCCQYIGEGDFLCDRYMEIVVSDWEPTESYLMCQNQNKVVGGDADEKRNLKSSVSALGFLDRL